MTFEKTIAVQILEAVQDIVGDGCFCEEKTIGAHVRRLWMFAPCKKHQRVYELLKQIEPDDRP